jgi:hypothetical protein
MPSAGITLKQTDIPFLAGVSSTFTAPRPHDACT